MIYKSLLTSILIFLTISAAYTQVTDNFQYLLDSIQLGKTFSLSKAKRGDKNVVKEKETYYIKIVPPKYKIVQEEIEISPALNGNMDTSNYFIQTEIIELKEPGAHWKRAKISKLCTGGDSEIALCLLKTVPKYQIVHRKFYPFKNILDISNTDYVVPAQTITVEKQVLAEPSRLERYTADNRPEVNVGDGEYLVQITAGNWRVWEHVVCPFGVFNTPDVRDIQKALMDREYDVKITNKYDEQTRRALHQFQEDQRIPVGELSDLTIQRLNVQREKLITIID